MIKDAAANGGAEVLAEGVADLGAKAFIAEGAREVGKGLFAAARGARFEEFTDDGEDFIAIGVMNGGWSVRRGHLPVL